MAAFQLDARQKDRVFRPPRSSAYQWRIIASLLLFAIVSSGCTPWREYVRNGYKVGPNFQQPAAPVAPQWIDAADARLQGTNVDLMNWWTVFKDPTLDGLVYTAYQQNLTLRDAGFRILQARAQLQVARGTLFPQTQTMTGDYQREATTRNAANRSFVQTRYFDQFDHGFNLAWEIDFWGRFRRAIESSNENLNVSIDNYDAVLVTLLGDVAAAYVQIRTLERQIEFTRANVELQRQTLVLADARFKGGTATDLDVEQARTVMEQTAAQIPVLEISLRMANNQLCILMGMPPEDLKKLIGSGDIPKASVDVAAGIPADLLRRRPDVRRAERAAAAQSAQIGIAEAEFYPHISIIGTLDYSSQSLANLYTPGSMLANVGPSYYWNILTYGRILNNVRAQDALFKALVVDYQRAVLTGAQEVENGLVTFVKSQEQTARQSASVEAADKAVQIALAQYRGGLVDFNRVATLELILVQQQNLLAQARGQIATGLINVYRALGGGWQIRYGLPEENDSTVATLTRIPQPTPEPLPVPKAAPDVLPKPPG